MPEILKYVHVDEDGEQDVWEYDTLKEAISEASEGQAVLEREYVYEGSSLAWTPDRSKEWPPADPIWYG